MVGADVNCVMIAYDRAPALGRCGGVCVGESGEGGGGVVMAEWGKKAQKKDGD